MTDSSPIKPRTYLLPSILIIAILLVIGLLYTVQSNPCKKLSDTADRDNCYLIQLETDWNKSWCDKIENTDQETLCHKKYEQEMRFQKSQEKEEDERSIRERLLERKEKEELRNQIRGTAPEYQFVIDADGKMKQAE